MDSHSLIVKHKSWKEAISPPYCTVSLRLFVTGSISLNPTYPQVIHITAVYPTGCAMREAQQEVSK